MIFSKPFAVSPSTLETRPGLFSMLPRVVLGDRYSWISCIIIRLHFKWGLVFALRFIEHVLAAGFLFTHNLEEYVKRLRSCIAIFISCFFNQFFTCHGGRVFKYV